MKKVTRTQVIIILVIINIIISFTCFLVGYINFLYPKLGDFTIETIKEDQENLIVNLSPSHNAITYEIEVMDDQNNVIYTKKDQSNQVPIEKLNVSYGNVLQVKAKAYNKNGKEKEANSLYTYTYNDPTFLKDQDHYISTNHNVILNLIGWNENSNCNLELWYKNELLETISVGEPRVTIPYNSIKNYSGRITAKLKNAYNRVLSEFNFYLNTPVVGKVDIVSPEENFVTRWNDVTLKIVGGTNSNKYLVNLYKDGKLETNVYLEKKDQSIIIPSMYFGEESNYTVELYALYEDYIEIAQKDSVNIYIGKKETTSPVYVSHNPSTMKENSLLELKTMTNDATIYYTLDGSEPNELSFEYKGPILVKENMLVKTYAKSTNRYNSAINSYPIQINNKPITVFLSPSNQDMNYGVSGYSNEAEIMNLLADKITDYLQQAGITVYRNWSSGEINGWISKSNQVQADFHLALHSNASTHHTARGIEIYVNHETAKALAIASNIYENLWEIYPGNNNFVNHRGVKYANGSLGEVNTDFLPCGALIEVAYHDNYDDALWMVQNLDAIALNISNSIIKFYM